MILVKEIAKENGSHENQTCDHTLEGYLVLPDELKPEHFPFFSITSYEGNTITAVEDGVFPAVSAEINRRNAYENDRVIDYGGDLITVDEARNICMEYEFETTDRAMGIVSELMAKITAAKEAIRARYAE